jgi:hypothetical protein
VRNCFLLPTLFLYAVLLAGCAAQPAVNAVVNANTPNVNVAVAASNATPAPTPQASPTVAEQSKNQTPPDALVAELYKQHDKKHSPFYQTKDRALIEKYFDKSTADLIWKDAVGSKGEVGALDADPLYDAQDTDIKKFTVGQPKYEDGRAEVTVSFENFGEKQKIVFLLVSKDGAWKISDIKYADGRTLTGMLKGAAPAASKR